MPDLAAYYYTQGVLGVTVIVLAIVVIKLYNAKDKLEKEKEELLQAWRLEAKSDSKDIVDVLKGNSQSLLYLADKIQIGKQEDTRNVA